MADNHRAASLAKMFVEFHIIAPPIGTVGSLCSQTLYQR